MKDKNGVAPTKCHPAITQNKRYFDMMKITKSNPISKRDRVKNELYMYMIEIQILTDISLTAMGRQPTENVAI